MAARAIVAVSLVTACASVPATAALEKADLRLSVDLGKGTYVLGEPIVARLTVTNMGNTTVTSRWFSYTSKLFLRLEDTEGRAAPLEVEYGRTERPLTFWERPLAPGETVSTAFDLTRGDIVASSGFFPKLAKFAYPQRAKIPGYTIGPGTYRLVARHGVGSGSELKATAEFTIRAPTEAEREALLLFESNAYFDGPDAEWSQLHTIADYSAIWREHLTTPFAPCALYYAARLLQQRGRPDAAITKYALLRKERPTFPLMAEVLYYETLALYDSGRVDEAKALAKAKLLKFKNHLVGPDVETREKGSRIELLLAKLDLTGP